MLHTLAGDAMPMAEVGHPAESPGLVERDYRFEGTLSEDFQWLRTPEPDTIFSLTARPGHLRLYGRETMGSLFTQALVARRQQAFCYTAEVGLDVNPAHFQQAAGLVCYHNGAKFHYLHISHDETLGRVVSVMSALPDSPQADAFTVPMPIPDGPIELGVEVDFERLRFRYRMAGAAEWTWLPQVFDTSILSDEASAPGQPAFTGAFVGVAAQDMAGTAMPTDVAWFTYCGRDYRA